METEKTQYHDRFKGAPWYTGEGEQVLVGGAGGIGSWLSLFLARAGFRPTVVDPDTVEAHNIGGQMFRIGDVGRPKVEAVRDIIGTFGEPVANALQHMVEHIPGHHFCFSAFDNMEAREVMMEKWLETHEGCPVTPILIDGRLNMEQVQVFCVTPATVKVYRREHLFPDSEVEDAPCTMKQTTHAAAIIAGLMTAMFTNHMANIRERAKIREVPFFQEVFLPMALTEVRPC